MSEDTEVDNILATTPEVDDDMTIPDTAVADYDLRPTPTPTPTTSITASLSPPSTWAQSQLVSSSLTPPGRAQVEFPNPTLDAL